MNKALCALAVTGMVVAAAPANAAISFDFTSPAGLLTSSQTYTDTGGSGLQVFAQGFDNLNAATNLFGKANGGDENGLGLANDPTGDNEISFGHGYIQLDVNQLIGNATNVQFFMNSTTDGEAWNIYGSNSSGIGSAGTLLANDNNEALHFLPAFGTYRFYNFFARNEGNNVLLGGLSADVAVPEAATWTMILAGFGLMGGAMRLRSRKVTFTTA